MCLSKKGVPLRTNVRAELPLGFIKNPALKRFPQFRIFPSMERVTGSRGRGLVQHGMVQLTFCKGAVHKYAVCKIATLKNFPCKRQASKPFSFTITFRHVILLSAQFFQQSSAALQHILPCGSLCCLFFDIHFIVFFFDKSEVVKQRSLFRFVAFLHTAESHL